ncbi:TrkH family potassium uptake protein, partial [bacterium]|nr:TrkH family potassium uptake protein [bacterium]
MRINFICSAIGLILRYVSVMLLIPCIVAYVDKDYSSIIPFVVASAFSVVVGLILRRNQESLDSLNNIKKSEALFTVSLSWIAICIISAIPYLFYGLSPLDSLFEATSGITTTGATILTNFDYPKAMFLWRSLSQWLGGMGIIVLFIAILPQFRVAGRQMFYAEAPGPTEEKVTPRIRHTATALWGIYVFLTGLQILLYKLSGMNIFEAVCNSMSTVAAGGFSPHPESIMGYNSSPIIWITILFMFLSGANFALQYKVLVQRKYAALIRSEEFKLYLGLFLGISLLVALFLWLEGNYSGIIAVRDSLFQTISTMTSTGFAAVDYTKWALPAKVILFLAMFTGACAGSAAGGV